MKSKISLVLMSALLLCGCNTGADRLASEFKNPPAEYRPRVWWHWEDGNVTKDGIKKDLDWMKRAGIGGFHHFDASIGIDPIVENRLIYMQDGWKDAFRYAIHYADSLGMEMGIASSPGWSSTGGPWVSKEDAMKEIVWTSTDLHEGEFKGVLEQPKTRLDYYKDIRTIAVRLPESDGKVKAVTVYGADTRNRWSIFPANNHLSLERSSDGRKFEQVALLPNTSIDRITVNVPATEPGIFRLVDLKDGRNYSFELHTRSMVEHAEDKAGLSSPYDLNEFRTVAAEGETFATCSDVIDISDRIGEDGTLEWTVPAGDWRVIRFGYTLTGKQNGPAPKEATGLEVDKMDPDAWDRYFHNYLDMYKEATGGLMGERGIQCLLLDSFEAWWDTWTPNMEQEFEARRGYSMVPWIPSLAGMILESPEATEKFLFDWRQTISELHEENYARLDKFVKEYGLQNLYLESHENGRVYLVDGIDVKKHSTVPMAACWAPLMENTGHSSRPMAFADIRESASVAHFYGQNVVAVESLTTDGYEGNAFTFSPAKLKNVIDFEYAAGMNKVFIHESSHQPLDDVKPGLGLRHYGQWFTRHETWAEQAIAWTDYMARTSYMLRQGGNISDILVYYGEDTNVTGRYGKYSFEAPLGFNYDFVNPNGLFDLKVENGMLVAPSGAQYAVLCTDIDGLPQSERYRERLEELKAMGATVCTREELPGTMTSIVPDAKTDEDIVFLHRHSKDADIYWINKTAADFRMVELEFRCTRGVPEAWDPVTGDIRPVSYERTDKGTKVFLDMVPDDAQFIVFSGNRTSARNTSYVVPEKADATSIALDGHWTLEFPGRTIHNASLGDYSQYDFEDVKYFSGTASYRTVVNFDEIPSEVSIDLGEVHDLAEVYVNGEKIAILWKVPFVADVTDALRAGENEIEVRVINTWANRIIGDQQPDCPQKTTYFNVNFYKADSPTYPAGLVGPVVLKTR